MTLGGYSINNASRLLLLIILRPVNPRTRNGILLILMCLILVVLRFEQVPKRMLTWDVFGYYLYLPAQFIHDDLTLQNKAWLDEVMVDYTPSSTLYQAVRLENGHWVMKYSMGMAVLLSPFFFIAHLLAPLLGYTQDGFSLPYQLSMACGGLVFAFLGLWLFYKVLRRFFDQHISIISVALIFLGTNYLHLTAWDGTLLTHNILFTLYAGLIYFTIRWHDAPNWPRALGLGAMLGLITLVRPSEAVAILIPMAWMVYDRKSLGAKIKLIASHPMHLVLLIFAGLAMVAPQLTYWKHVTGEYLFFSYTNAGEGLDLLAPHTKDFLFSFRKGWVIYTPLILLAFFGFIPLFRKHKEIGWALLIFLIVDVYVVSSWTNWWYAGGSFSARAMVPAYVVMGFPIAASLVFIRDLKKVSRMVWGSLIGLLVLLNLFQTWQWKAGIIDHERMTKEYYWAIFGKTQVTEADRALLSVGRPVSSVEELVDESRYVRSILYTADLDESGLTMNGQMQFSPGPNVAYSELCDCDHAWLRLKARIYLPEDYAEEDPLLVCSFSHKEELYKYSSSEGKLALIKGQWNEVHMDYITPEVRSVDDRFSAYIWHRGSSDIQVEDLSVELFVPGVSGR